MNTGGDYITTEPSASKRGMRTASPRLGGLGYTGRSHVQDTGAARSTVNELLLQVPKTTQPISVESGPPYRENERNVRSSARRLPAINCGRIKRN